jgi:hypothetical protein
MADRIIYRSPRSGLFAIAGQQDTARGAHSTLYEALVVDVILDHTHPRYSRVDGNNVGSIKVRILEVDELLDDDKLQWADPLDYNSFQMPLIGEMVLLFKLRGNFFYKNSISFVRKPTENAFLNLNRTLRARPNRSLQKLLEKKEPELSLESHKFGKYWRPDSRVRQLKHFEGDIIFQGRMGHSIRFGSSKSDPSSKGLAPNLLLRTGQAKDIETERVSFISDFGLILEDINKDVSSIWMVSDQKVPFEPTTINVGSFYRSIGTPTNVFDGGSITINSDRLVLNSKKSHLMLFSGDEVYINSFKRTSIDTDESIFLTANIDIIGKTTRNIEYFADKDFNVNAGGDYRSIVRGNTSFLSNKIFIGSSSDDKEPLVGGTSLSIFLARLITALMGVPNTIRIQPRINPRINIPRTISPGIATTVHGISAMGPVALSPAIVSALTILYGELANGTFSGAPFSSQDNFVNLRNESVRLELNEFKDGEVVEVENNEWLLDDDYYKVT